MDQVMRDSTSAEEGINPKPSEWDYSVERLRNDKFIVTDDELLEKFDRLILDKYQNKPARSRATQTAGGQSQTRLDDLLWNEQMKYTKRSLESLMNNKSKSGRKVGKDISDYFDTNASYETLSSEIKDRFTSLNLKLSMEIPEDFKIWIDCKHFRPDKIHVAVVDGCVELHAEHDVQLDEHGLIKREFTHRWTVPDGVRLDRASCLLDKYGILTIRAPRKPTSVTIPVQIEKLQDVKSIET